MNNLGGTAGSVHTNGAPHKINAHSHRLLLTGIFTFFSSFQPDALVPGRPMSSAPTANNHRAGIPRLSFRRLVSSFSVRSRIIAIAMIPVAGFLANGFFFAGGEKDVEAAFDRYKIAAAIADASRDFKENIGAMRISARDFAARPGSETIGEFESAAASAVRNLNAIAASADERQRLRLAPLNETLTKIADNFRLLIKEQRDLGFTDEEGLRGQIRNAGNAVERIINNEMTWLGEVDAKRLLMSLLIMRRYEAERRLTPSTIAYAMFFKEYKTFSETFAAIDGTPALRGELESQIKRYAEAFELWSESANTVSAYLAIIDLDTKNMMPAADDIILSAIEGASRASTELAESQERTRLTIISVGVLAVLIGLAFSWLIGRSITGPLAGLAGAMQRLARGDTSARIPATHARDEIGEMARTVIVFRDNMVEREHLAATQSEQSRAR
jgi:methyl-accepting chemotaxis protein